MPRPRTLLASLLLALLAALPLSAAFADWHGGGRAHGVVLDDDGEPLAGAEVRLVWTGPDGGGPEPAVTGPDGEWAFVLLAPGVWRVMVAAEGFHPAEGRVGVPTEGPGPRTVVRMRSLDEVSPSFAEGDPERSVRQWLESGDALLEDGRTAEARAEYRKALATPGVLSAADRGEVLATVARTFFLEGNGEEALRHLRAAVIQSPEDGRARELLTVLGEQQGRSEAVERFFDRLEREPEELAEELGDLLEEPEERPESELPERPTLEPAPDRTGRFRTELEGRSPLSDVGVFVERYGFDRDELDRIDPAVEAPDELQDETFEVFVPDEYGRAPAGEASEEGWGLIVWVSPGVYGGLDTVERQEVLAEHRLLWVGANRSGNERFIWDRVGLALDAARAMTALYDLDPDRIYAAGYSGGGRIASALGQLYPEVFRGALSLFGCNYFRPVAVPDRPGAHWPAAFAEPPRPRLRTIREAGRFVLVTGELDFNRAQTRATYEAMEEDGFEGVTYLEIPGADHYQGIDPEWLGRALDALDDPESGERAPAGG